MGFQCRDEQTVERLRSFVETLNDESESGSIIVVEGRRDAEALSNIGFTGSPTVFHNSKGVSHFVDAYGHTGRKIILLLDMDRTGRHLTSRLLSQLQLRRNHVNLHYKRTLAKITNGRVRHIEELTTFASQISGIMGSRKDLYFYI